MANENHGAAKEEAALMSHSPSTSHQNQPSSPKPVRLVQDLPDELVHAGWEKCWSKRENRPYYFNRFTNQSLWEMPLLGQHDVISDPLGLNAAPATAEGGVGDGAAAAASTTSAPTTSAPTPTTPTTTSAPAAAENKVQKRRLSEEVQPSGNSVKKLKSVLPSQGTFHHPLLSVSLPLRVYWDLDIQTNAVIKQRPPSDVLCPHPEVELLRSQLMLKLRTHYRELCQQREGIDPPRESFNRWMLERKVVDKGSDPLLPSSCEPVVSPSMFREIMNDIPIRLSRIKFREEAKRLLFKYAEAAKRLIESRSASPDSRKVVKWNVEDTFSWLRRDHSASMGPPNTAYVTACCCRCLGESDRARSVDLLCKPASQLPEVDTPEAQDRLVYCFPVRLATRSPPLPNVEMHVENNVVCVRYKGEMVKVSRNYFSKLWLLYRYSCIDDSSFERFLPRVWCLLRRYQMMFGVGLFEGTGLQGSIPVHIFEALHKLFGVSFECFASPLNCYFKQYCSAFPDTDGYFGSRGPCLDFFPVSGSFEANPPFCEELMDAMVTHFEKLLGASSEPLSFIVFIPEWRDPPTPALTRMEQSSFKRHQLILPAFDHEYRSGSQHLCKKEEMYYKAVHNTAVLFLQNEAGFAKWEPTPERLQELVAAFKHSGRTLAAASAAAAASTATAAASSSSSDKEREAAKEPSAGGDSSTPN
nr:mRNA (2'-O-methyladenosine-N(6)-)-methyltransferase [Anolis sagrei ordinatus]